MNLSHIPAAIISVIVLLAFAFNMHIVLINTVPAGNEKLADIMLGALAVMATTVVNYWTISGASSARKDATIADQSKMLAASAPIMEVK